MFSRLSARLGQPVALNVDFYRNGILVDPFVIKQVEIYKSQVLPHNLVAVIPIINKSESIYPAPAQQDTQDIPAGQCGTEPFADVIPGKYTLPFTIPTDFSAPDVYFDVWYYYADDPCPNQTEECQTEELLLKSCHRFWVYPDSWYTSDDLQTIRFGFEPLDQKFNSPEVRPLEVGLMPLPLYDYNFNLVNPMIPYLKSTISIETMHCELLVDKAPCQIAIRQGSYRSNPWVIRYQLNTAEFLRGTYKYSITVTLPDGSTRVSPKYVLTIS